MKLESIDLSRHPECKDMPLVIYMANQFRKLWGDLLPGGLEMDDLIQVGYLTLLRCKENYNPQKKRQITYSKYLAAALRHQMSKWIHSHLNSIHVSDNARLLMKKLARGDQLSETHLKRAKKAIKVCNMKRSTLESIASTQAIGKKEKREWITSDDVTNALQRLNPRQRKIIEWRYKRDMNLAQIAESCVASDQRITRQRIHQIHLKAIKVLQEVLLN